MKDIRFGRRTASACLAIAALAGAAAMAPRAHVLQPESAVLPPHGREAALVLTGYGVMADGSTVRAGGDVILSADRTSAAQVYVPAGPACPVSFSTSAGPVTPAAAVAWLVEAQLVALAGDTATIDLRWARNVAASALSPADSIERRRTVTIREGEARAFDVVHVQEEDPAGCDRYVVELGLRLLDPAEVAGAALQYDLWLVHREPGGRDATERLRINGRQGAKLEYLFAPLIHAVGVAPVGSDGALRTTISGAIRGRARPDGLIDLTVDTWRNIGGGTNFVGTGGVKQLTVRPGETIEMALPPGRPGESTAIRITATRAG